MVCFFICWSTFFALTVTAIVIKDSSKLPRGLGIAAYWTGYLNSALNPIIICSMSIRFKEGFLNVYRQFSKLFQCTCLPRGRLLEQKVCLGQSTEFTDCSSQGTFLRKQSTNGLEAVVDKRPPVSIRLQHIYNNGDLCIDKDHSVVWMECTVNSTNHMGNAVCLFVLYKMNTSLRWNLLKTPVCVCFGESWL